ncbi:MAG TPA: glycosyltransferase family 4 protein [Candidatus Saccharimonadales bacterium]|nr:glycosyltransferase family 4 protein [Candidatus Saccharimonadales bacterium]
MKILMVNDYKYEIAGTEIYLFTIMDSLKKNGHEVRLFASEVSAREYFSISYNKSFVKYMQRIFSLKYYLKFRKILREFEPDIIHIHNVYNEITPSILCNIKHKAILMTVHGSQMVSPVSMQTERTGKMCKETICEGCINCVGWKGYLYEKVKKSVYRKLLQNITIYISPSNYLKSILEEKQYLPVIRIYNGIKLLKYSKIKDTKNLLYVGRLTKEKGLDVLLNAIKKLTKTIPEIHLMIVGEGNYSTNILNTIKDNNLQNNILVKGSISRKLIQTYYDNSVLLIIPSIYPDNLPTVGLEALSVGRPIIGSNIGGISEIIKNNETGIVVSPGDAGEIANGVIKIIHNKKKLQQMNREAREYAEKQFDIKNHTRQLELLYDNLLKKI